MSWFRRLLIEGSIALLLLGSHVHAQQMASPSEAVGLPSGPSVVPGNIPGNVAGTNACNGCVGQLITNISLSPTTTATVSFTNATPTVVTWTANGFTTGQPVYFTGSVPTGVTASTTYYATVINANTFHISTTLANLYNQVYVATSSTGTTPTGFAGNNLTSASFTSADTVGFQLPPGAWNVCGVAYFTPGGTTTETNFLAWVSTSANTLPSPPNYVLENATFSTGSAQSMATGCIQSISSATTNVSLQAESTFGTSTMASSGILWALRYQ